MNKKEMQERIKELEQQAKDENKIWIFTDEYEEEHEFTDPYEMMNYMWQHYIGDNVKIGWRNKE